MTATKNRSALIVPVDGILVISVQEHLVLLVEIIF